MLYPHRIQAQTKTGGGVGEGWVGLGRVGSGPVGLGWVGVGGWKGGCNNVLVFWLVGDIFFNNTLLFL